MARFDASKANAKLTTSRPRVWKMAYPPPGPWKGKAIDKRVIMFPRTRITPNVVFLPRYK